MAHIMSYAKIPAGYLDSSGGSLPLLEFVGIFGGWVRVLKQVFGRTSKSITPG